AFNLSDNIYKQVAAGASNNEVYHMFEANLTGLLPPDSTLTLINWTWEGSGNWFINNSYWDDWDDWTPPVVEEEEEQEADNQEPSLDDMPPEHGDKMPDNELLGGEEMPDEMSDELGDEAGGETEDDPNKQGMIRTVPGAHLIYKRSNTEGNFEELWIFHISPGVRDEMDIRREVLAGTDIHPEQTRSEDGSQNVEMWAAGNALLMKITGLPN
ncbi:hypothetical protein LCGC14_0696500, partial [marine sediment metagenome]